MIDHTHSHDAGPPADAPDFWTAVRYPRFRSTKPRVLILAADYFLYREITSGLDMLGVEHARVNIPSGERGTTAFIEELLAATLRFKPDFALTVNHMGLDREGLLADLLDRMSLPLASWFVDNPHLILHQYAHPATNNVSVFTFDAGNLDTLRAKGFSSVHYLPLATDPTLFRPAKSPSCPPDWASEVSFVGNSMTEPVQRCLKQARLPKPLADDYRKIAASFGASDSLSVDDFLEKEHPDWHRTLTGMDTPERKLALESLITWEATRQYRLACVQGIMGHDPLIVGDTGWQTQLASTGWRLLPPLDYYADLPAFYQCPAINFNATSRQMKGAVNQRLFDVPACGGFLLTDRREQLEDLLEPGREVAVYDTPEDVPALVDRYLADPETRRAMTRAARKRILAQHTYRHRLESLLSVMRQAHGGGA